mgnify:CR=1 FL=1
MRPSTSTQREHLGPRVAEVDPDDEREQIPELVSVPARADRRATAATWLRLGVVPLCLAAVLVPAWLNVVLQPAPWVGSQALALVIPVAVVVAYLTLRQPPVGPPIHDRQLDFILGTALTLGALEMLYLAGQSSGTWHGAAAIACISAAVVVIGWGTRALWQLRAPLLLLLLTWQGPWVLLAERAWPAAESLASTLRADLLGDRADVVALDPAAGGSVLLLVFVGVLVGLGGAAYQSGRMRRAVALAAGIAAGVAAATVVWVATLALTAVDAAIADHWSSGLINGAAVGLLAVAAGLKLVGRGARTATQSLTDRLRVAVPRLRVSTVVLLALGVLFHLTGAAEALSGAPSS